MHTGEQNELSSTASFTCGTVHLTVAKLVAPLSSINARQYFNKCSEGIQSDFCKKKHLPEI
jgi:hypothetical protein